MLSLCVFLALVPIHFDELVVLFGKAFGVDGKTWNAPLV